jgi:hypothetical protein
MGVGAAWALAEGDAGEFTDVNLALQATFSDTIKPTMTILVALITSLEFYIGSHLRTLISVA